MVLIDLQALAPMAGWFADESLPMCVSDIELLIRRHQRPGCWSTGNLFAKNPPGSRETTKMQQHGALRITSPQANDQTHRRLQTKQPPFSQPRPPPLFDAGKQALLATLVPSLGPSLPALADYGNENHTLSLYLWEAAHPPSPLTRFH